MLHDFSDDLESLRSRLARAGTGRARTAASDAQFADLFHRGSTEAVPRSDSRAGARALATAGVDQERDRRIDQTFAQLAMLGDHLAAIPGRKSLIWIGAGTPILSFSAPAPTDANGWLKLYGPLLERTAQRLASQDIAVYPVDARGLTPPQASGRPGSATPRPLLDSSRREASMDRIAELTGGRVTRNTNDPATGIRLASADIRGSYTAAFYSPGEPDGRWHAVSLKAARKNVKLTYRQGFLAWDASAQPREWGEDEWLSAISNPVGSTALLLDVGCDMAHEAGGLVLQTRLQVPSRELLFVPAENGRRAEVEFAVIEKDAEGDFRTQRRQVVVRVPDNPALDLSAEAAQFASRWKIDSTTATIRFLARDRLTGRYGAIDVPVSKIPPPGETREAAAAAQSEAGASEDPFIERARRVSREFLDTLPNYVVRQTTMRSVQARASRGSTLQDRIAAEVVYEKGKETTRDVTLNGKPVAADVIEHSGAWSTGQFGGMLNALFAPQSEAVFRKRHGTAKVAGREALVYDFSVERANSSWELMAGSRKYLSAYDGTVWLDRETARTLRFHMRARNLPGDFPLDQAESSTDYGFVRIGAGEYLVPTGSVALNLLARARPGRRRSPSPALGPVALLRPQCDRVPWLQAVRRRRQYQLRPAEVVSSARL